MGVPPGRKRNDVRSVSGPTSPLGETGPMADLLTLDRRDDGVAVITLANGKVNALSSALLRELHEAADALAADLPGAVVITGGERIFAAGADISEFGGQDEAGPITAAFHGTLDAIAALPRFVIASVSGYALGGGCELALACDYRIAGPRAVFGQPEILLGIIPGAGGTQRLARLVGPSKAKDIVYTGRFVDANEALAIGLVDEVTAPDDVYAAARRWAERFATGATRALAAAKAAIDGGLDGDLASGLKLESHLFAALFATEDQKTGMRSFIENGPGKANFSGK